MTPLMEIGQIDLKSVRTLIEHTSDTILIVNPDGIVTFVSPSAEELTGVDTASICGTSYLEWVAPEDLERVNQAFQHVAQGNIIKIFSAKVMHSSGDRRHCEASAVPMIEDGVVIGVSCILRDVTEAHITAQSLEKTNADLMDALKQLSQAQEGLVQKERERAFSEIAGGVAHDFNNILTLVLGHTEILGDEYSARDPAAFKDSIEVIKKASLDGQHIVRRLRGLYSPNNSDDCMDRVDINAVITELGSLTRIRRQENLKSKRGYIELHLDLRPVCEINANHVELNEALLNILLNAFDAMPDGGTVSISTRQLGDSISVRIADTGHGMTSEQEKRCLDAFYTTKGAHGTGLGLSEAASIVKRFKGAIQVDTEVGLGTTFTLTFPGIAVAGKTDEDISRLSVLVHSDDNDIFNVINAYLRLDDHRVQRITADELASLHNSKADVVVRFSESISGNMESDANQVLMQPACPWSSHVAPACPCNTAAVILPLSLAQFREGLEVCSTSRSSCANASKYIVSSADEA
jgi:PAS domain S-box-containing protein